MIGYALSPIDLIPDFVPVLGYLDDLILLPLGIILVQKLIPSVVIDEYKEKAKEILWQEKPKNWVGAGVIVFIWIIIAFLVLRLVRK